MDTTRRCVSRIPTGLNVVILQADSHDPDGVLMAREVLMFTPSKLYSEPTHELAELTGTHMLYVRERL